MSEANLQAMRAFFDLGNAHDAAALAEMVHQNYVGESDVLPQPIVGRDAYRSLLMQFWTAFPDTRYNVEHMLAADDCVVTRVTLTGTHSGNFMGREGTGRKFSIRLCHVDQWRDGKIARAWYYWDTATLMRQLGLSTEASAVNASAVNS